MAKIKIESAKFKKDYMMLLAFLLFFLIVASECFLAVWLPWHLKLEKTWAEHVARQELIDLFDKVRAGSRRGGERLPAPSSEESILICRSLDRATGFMRQYGHSLEPEQCRNFMDVLNRLYTRYRYIAKSNAYSRIVNFSANGYLKKLRGIEVKNSSGR